MKLLATLATALAFTLPTLACLRIKGGITHDPLPGLSGIWNVEAIDNGVTVCGGKIPGSWIDQDGHYSMGCLPGYVYAFEKNGNKAWFKNPSKKPGEEWSFLQHPRSNRYCCHGACDDKGVKLQCTDYEWDLTQFC
ncbi:hypothetical protein GQ44DRAFT_761877 [Phaeosphaeriaceae sp. PMI808]|nr:hypothetical protein GQ44DRAFT_761877 [Phaeosphaeriaceae sp. PMI808]